MIKINTPYGTLEVELYEKEVPNTVKNFKKLINNKFYTDLIFHRVIPGFVVQGGCPDGNGRGGPGYTIDCELDTQKQYHR